MYCPAHFREDDPAALRGLIEQFPLGAVICQGADGLVADHIPLLHEAVPDGLGRLVGHVAKSNPLWLTAGDQEVLVIFQGPSTYISPNWYVSKQESGKVVPTWNYAVVHAHCVLRAIHEPAQLLGMVAALTDRHESTQPHPWGVDDAPADYTSRLLSNIVGIHLEIRRWQGKWKVSQNQPKPNQLSVVDGLVRETSDARHQMAECVRARTGS